MGKMKHGVRPRFRQWACTQKAVNAHLTLGSDCNSTVTDNYKLNYCFYRTAGRMKIKTHKRQCPGVGNSFTQQVKESLPSSCGSGNQGGSVFKNPGFLSTQWPSALRCLSLSTDLSHSLCVSHGLAERSWRCPEGGTCHSEVLHGQELRAGEQPVQLGRKQSMDWSRCLSCSSRAE